MDTTSQQSRAFPVLPVVAFIAVWLGGSWLVVGAWLRPWLPGGWAAVAAGLALGAFQTLTLIRGVRCVTYPSAATRLLILRPFWYAMLWMPLLAGAAVSGGLLGLPFGSSGSLGRGFVVSAAGALAVAAVIGYAGSGKLVVRRQEVRLPRLPTAFDGLRVVQISDLHVGPHTSGAFLERVAGVVRDEQPELLVSTGDQVDDFARDVDRFNEFFAGLESPLGSYAIAGNHDVYAGWTAVGEGLAAAGWKVLVNEATAVERDGARLWIAGTGDPAGNQWPSEGARLAAPDVERTLAGIAPAEPVLALAHNPAVWPPLAAAGVDLTLSGHTHYGQFAIPRFDWCMASPFLKLAMGWHREGDAQLYIHPGTNYWGIPFRIGTPPEVTILTLRSGRQR